MKDKRALAERLLNALGEIDDELLDEAYFKDTPSKLTRPPKPRFSSPLVRQLASAAACIIIIAGVMAIAPKLGFITPPIADQDGSSTSAEITAEPEDKTYAETMEQLSPETGSPASTNAVATPPQYPLETTPAPATPPQYFDMTTPACTAPEAVNTKAVSSTAAVENSPEESLLPDELDSAAPPYTLNFDDDGEICSFMTLSGSSEEIYNENIDEYFPSTHVPWHFASNMASNLGYADGHVWMRDGYTADEFSATYTFLGDPAVDSFRLTFVIGETRYDFVHTYGTATPLAESQDAAYSVKLGDSTVDLYRGDGCFCGTLNYGNVSINAVIRADSIDENVFAPFEFSGLFGVYGEG